MDFSELCTTALAPNVHGDSSGVENDMALVHQIRVDTMIEIAPTIHT